MWGAAGFLLLLPAIAMRFTPEVNWTASDFIFWGVMLATACGLYELATRLSDDGCYRAGFATAVLTAFLVTWSNLAVGIIGNEDNELNLLFFALLALGAAGAALVRFRARGLARVAAMLGLAQLMIALSVFAAGWDNRGATFSLVFVALWATSYGLFSRAAEKAGNAG